MTRGRLWPSRRPPASSAGGAKRYRVPALALSITMLTGSVIGLVLTERHQQQARSLLDQNLSSAAAQRTDTLQSYFERTRAVDLLLSRNPAFSGFYDAPGQRAQKVADPAFRSELTKALTYLETLYPGSIGEACFIDAGGAENARVVNGAPAPLADLSPDESKNPFFAPSFAKPVGQVYQAPPYVSPDTKQWVVSVATPITSSGGGGKRAIVHFEVTVDSFRAS